MYIVATGHNFEDTKITTDNLECATKKYHYFINDLVIADCKDKGF